MTNSLLQKLDTFSKVALLRPEKTLTGNSMYEVVLNSGCLTASPQELQRQKAIAIFKALKHKEIPGVNFITSATERLPEG
jgi:hypothetical protein